MTQKDFNDSLLGFLDASPTPYHAVANMAGMLFNMGFIELSEFHPWELEEGKKYFVIRNGSSLIAFTYTKDKNYTMVGAHTDSPTLKVKPNPVIRKNNTVQLGVEPYGGLLMNPWFDRDLGLAGRVAYEDSNGEMHEHLININRPVAMIPSLAIHLDKEANKNRSINAQTDIVPILTTDLNFEFDSFLKEVIAAHNGSEEEINILSHDLSFYDLQNAAYIGLDNNFMASARLDNLLSCYVALMAMVTVSSETPFLMVCSDHEEVGSESSIGAAGSFLESTLRRISGSDYEAFAMMMAESLLVSADNAHAVHPNYSDKHEPNHAPLMNEGVVIKINANQRYASSSRSIAFFKQAALKVDKKIQNYVVRSDMGCGSTIGPITATRLGLETVDVGLPTLAMHSIRELAGTEDAFDLFEILVELARNSG